MTCRTAALLLLFTACSRGAASPKLDGGTDPDGASNRDAADDEDAPSGTDAALDSSQAGPYRHTITVDGTDDFAAADTFETTSGTAYSAKLTWDDTTLFLGYQGPDLDPGALDSTTKWLFAYVDVDPGQGTGATVGQTYNTQTPQFPAGFGAEYYFRWKCDGTFTSVEQYVSGDWTAAATPTTARAGDYIEAALPRSLFGNAGKLGIVTLMMNEKAGFEGSYAGLYAGNFADGYAMTLAITKYLAVDFASKAAPNDPANVKP